VQNETKKCFEEVKYFNQQQTTLPTNCNDSENNVVSQTEQVLETWKEYFYNILNPKQTLITPDTIIRCLSDNHEIPSSMYNEICTVITKLKPNKAAGSDNITAELVKNGGKTLE
jgi:hypothetical protein